MKITRDNLCEYLVHQQTLHSSWPTSDNHHDSVAWSMPRNWNWEQFLEVLKILLLVFLVGCITYFKNLQPPFIIHLWTSYLSSCCIHLLEAQSKIVPQGDPRKIVPKGDPSKIVPKGDPSKIVPKGDPSKIVAKGDPLSRISSVSDI